MYPRAFFDTYWRGDVRNEVFVAMPFAKAFDKVYADAIKPAVASFGMQVNRADDPAKSGCILTRILDGIGHAKLVFVDISVMTMKPWKGQRNGNVMYELGVAHALRPETDLVVVRSDTEAINFDLGAIQVRSYPQRDLARARALFTDWIRSALGERNKMMSLIIERVRDRLDVGCINAMLQCGEQRGFRQFGRDDVALGDRNGIPLLLELDIIRCKIIESRKSYAYFWTDFGKAVYANPNFAK